MIAGIVQQALGGALLRARMEARKAAFAAAAGMIVMGALTLAGAAGIVVLSARYGVIAGLLAGAGLLLVLALLTFLLGRRIPGADASRRAVEAEAVLEDVPAPGVPEPEARSSLAALTDVHDAVRGRLDGILPPGSEGAVTALAARHLARRPVPTLAAALAAGALIGLVQMRRGASAGEGAGTPDPASAPQPTAPTPTARRRPARREAGRPVAKDEPRTRTRGA